jgi:hypothetical protein
MPAAKKRRQTHYKLITELQMLRDTLQSEAARVQREIVEYASLSQAALQSTLFPSCGQSWR